MKRHLVLEYRIRKLEKAILEDIDSDLDKMSDDILNRMPNDDLDTELDKKAKDIVNKDYAFNSVNKYGEKYEFDTINDWLDSIVFNLDLSNDDVVKVLSDRLKDVSLNFVGGPVWLSSVNRLRKNIKELSNASLPIAQQKLVNALRKRIKDIKNKKQLESLTYEGKRDQEILNDFLGDDYYNKYQIIKNRISDPDYKDIYKLIKKNPDEVKDYIDNFKSNRDSVKAAKEGARLIYEDDNWKVYKITTYDAAKYYGKGTRWCITGNYEGHEHLGEKYFNDYIRENQLDGGYYFYVNKNKPNLKFCVLQNVGGKVLSIWDAEDSNLGSTFGDVREYNLPKVPGINLSNYSIDALTRAMNDEDWDEAYDIIIHGDLNLNQWDKENRTALELAALYENEKAVQLLIQHGADSDIMSGNGFTPLLNAAIWGNYKIAELLLNSGADPDIPDGNRHKTPLFIAAQKGYINIVKLLVNNFGADTSIKSSIGETPLDAATANNKNGRNKEVIDYLMSVGAESTVDLDDYK